MSRSMEEMRDETARETLVSNLKTIMETLKLSAEQAMDALKVPEEKRTKIGKEL